MAIVLFSDCTTILDHFTEHQTTGATASWAKPVFSASLPAAEAFAAAWVEAEADCKTCGSLSVEAGGYDEEDFEVFVDYNGVTTHVPSGGTVVIALDAPGATFAVNFVSLTSDGPAASVDITIDRF
jgi:hypothetical protein